MNEEDCVVAVEYIFIITVCKKLENVWCRFGTVVPLLFVTEKPLCIAETLYGFKLIIYIHA